MDEILSPAQAFQLMLVRLDFEDRGPHGERWRTDAMNEAVAIVAHHFGLTPEQAPCTDHHPEHPLAGCNLPWLHSGRHLAIIDKDRTLVWANP